MLVGGAALVAGAGFLVACSDDTSVTTTDGGGPDGQADGPILPDGAPLPDAAPDAAFDGGFVLDTFDGVVAIELCKSLARCCYGTTTPGDGGADGGTFDMNACVDKFGKLGFEGSNISPALRDGGNVALDQLAADNCVNKVKAASCNLPGPEFKQIRDACFAVYTGKLGASSVCHLNAECQKGFFCKGSDDDGGAGVCTAIRALGGPCGDFTDDPFIADKACSYRGGGAPPAYCNFYDFDGGAYLDAGDWKCTAAAGAGNFCANSLWCEQTICGATSTCVTPDKIFDQSCGSYLVP